MFQRRLFNICSCSGVDLPPKAAATAHQMGCHGNQLKQTMHLDGSQAAMSLVRPHASRASKTGSAGFSMDRQRGIVRLVVPWPSLVAEQKVVGHTRENRGQTSPLVPRKNSRCMIWASFASYHAEAVDIAQVKLRLPLRSLPGLGCGASTVAGFHCISSCLRTTAFVLGNVHVADGECTAVGNGHCSQIGAYAGEPTTACVPSTCSQRYMHTQG